MDAILDKIQPLTSFSTSYGFDPEHRVDKRKMLTVEEARARHEEGAYYCLLFGSHKDPEYYIEIFQGQPETHRRIDVVRLYDNKMAERHIMAARPLDYGFPDLILTTHHEMAEDGRRKAAELFVTDAFVDGDFPRLTLNQSEEFAVSVPWQDFLLGAFPKYDALIDGSFVASIPAVTRPPEALITDYIPQDIRSPDTPKRAPIGRFPW